MNEIQVQLCYEANTYDGYNIANFLKKGKEFLSFDPKKIRCSALNLYGEKYEPHHIAKISTLTGHFGFSLESKSFTGPQFNTSYPAHRTPPQVLNWLLPMNGYANFELPSELLTNENFVIGYSYNIDYVLWEGEKMISTFESFEKPHKHLKKYYDTNQKLEMIDTSSNVGRISLVSNMFLGASWRMYIGKKFCSYISKDRILAFKGASVVQEIHPDVIFIELYENVEESSSLKSRGAQRQLRDWLQMDALESQLK